MAHSFKVGELVERMMLVGDCNVSYLEVTRVTAKSIWLSNRGSKPKMYRAEGDNVVCSAPRYTLSKYRPYGVGA